MIMQTSANRAFAASCAVATVLWASLAYGSLLVDFKPGPTNGLPEVVFAGVGPAPVALRAGPGSQGNGDGDLSPALQTPGGLSIETPFAVPGLIGGKVANPGGTTSFHDVTLVLEGLEVSGVAGPAGDMLYQPLGTGMFRLMASTGDQTLLYGHISDALIIRTEQGEGAVLSAHVQYWGGEIYRAMTKALGLGDPRSVPGEFSWSLLNMTPVAPMVAPGGYMPEFVADVAGQFSVVPEPSMMGLLGIGTLGMLRRRRA